MAATDVVARWRTGLELARSRTTTGIYAPEMLLAQPPPGLKVKPLVERVSVARMPTKYGDFQAYCYRSKRDGIEHAAFVHGDISTAGEVLCRVHSECLTGDIFGSLRCDCGAQLDRAMREVAAEGRGVVVYLRGHEGRGIGLGQKLRAYNLQDKGRDTLQANLDLGLPADAREYGAAAHILNDLNATRLRLMTNNPAKCAQLRARGLQVVRVPLLTPVHEQNRRYLTTKVQRMGHYSRDDLISPASGAARSASAIARQLGERWKAQAGRSDERSSLPSQLSLDRFICSGGKENQQESNSVEKALPPNKRKSAGRGGWSGQPGRFGRFLVDVPRPL